ncbi:ankyrin repeat domain-containing protein [Jiulongibacter sediminis]|jgi:ankyrin repeat protein|uniref:ankyrin repeat domain-containing protein n=1 Tax=Jiulongibacter sediminis TaxID=1605367 RepID=UPI0026EAC3A4|nr:ankyrin repeat domain-containing protein [Jiulongibacter sediminis]
MTTQLFSKIAEKINHEEYFYLILATENAFTGGLYPRVGSSVSYSNEGVEIFKEFSNEIQDLLRGTGVSIIYKNDSSDFQTKSIPKYNPELFFSDLFELIIFQEFAIKPADSDRLNILNESLEKDKIKGTLVYSCYANDTIEILDRVQKSNKAQLNRKLEYTGTPLGLCASHNNLECFIAIAEKGADINKKSLVASPLQLAFKHSPEIVKYIFSNHREAFDKEFRQKGFYIAAECKERETLDLLKNIGGDINKYDKSFPHIHNFTDRNNLIGIQFCLDNGIDVNMKDNQNRTPLNKAILRGHKDAIEFLRLKGGVE